MTVTERQRHALHEWAKQAGNEEVAETLMELLPPVGWADVATKRDLDHLGHDLERGVRLELHRELRRHTYWIVTSMWAAVGVAVGLSQAL